jgi:hypothetical protein
VLEANNIELQNINSQMPTHINWAKQNPEKAEQLVHDSIRLLSVTEEKFEETQNLPFFKRLMSRFNGSLTNQHLSTTKSFLELQKLGWQFMSLLQNEQLIQGRTLITIENNLTLLAANQEGFAKDIELMVVKIRANFNQLEDRMKGLEVQQNIHGWLLTIDTCDYDEKYPENFRLLKVLSDFINLKSTGDGNNINELRYLQKALKEVGLSWKKKITLADFINGLIDEIETTSFSLFENLLPTSNSNISHEFVKENISTPSYKALFEVANQYKNSSQTIGFIAEKHGLLKSEVLKDALFGFIGELGINLTTPISIRDLAVELYNCTRLTHELYSIAPSPESILEQDTSTDTDNHADKDESNEIHRSEHEVSGIIAIDLSISSASLAVYENGGTTLLKAVENCYLDPDSDSDSDSELKFQQTIRELLTDFKRIADVYRGKCCVQAIVTTPFFFSTRQKLAINEAADTLFNIYFTNRATAAALGEEVCFKQDNVAVICDVRGGTLDMSVIEIDVVDGEKTYEVLATAGTHYNSQTNLSPTAVDLLQQSLKDADLQVDEIDRLIVSGEESEDEYEIIKTVLQHFLGKQAIELTTPNITPMSGAVSSIGRILSGDRIDILLLDVTNHDIGIESSDGSLIPMVARHTTIPTKQSQAMTTIRDNQTSMIIHVLEANSSSTPLSNSLGYFELTGITPAPAGKPKIEITMDFTSRGVGHTVTAKELGSQTSNTLSLDFNSLSKELPSSPIELKAYSPNPSSK